MTDENLNDIKKLLEEKEEYLKCIVKILNRSERNNCFEYLKLLLNKDTVLYEIEQIKNIIICQTKDIENEKNEKKKEQLKSEMMEYIDMFENAI